ncbi:hypothetical protein Syun_007577 [Stephania yunnanensis]|uniref:Glutaredoxin-dependent peroxiredoxin n=1 Tax=Stephania yunnanensis TaxID=152371 RepID=A0AAP0KYZ5_9MAGN
MAFATLKNRSSLYSRLGFSRALASLSIGTDLVSSAPEIALQRARTWDEGVSSKFSTTPLKDIFKGKKVVVFGLPGAYTGVCSAQHVPSYKSNVDKFKAKGIDSLVCVAVNDPYVLNGWAEKLQAKDAIEFYGDFDGSFHKSFGLTMDLSGALLGERSTRWSAYVEDGKVKAVNIEKVPSEFKVSGAELATPMYGQLLSRLKMELSSQARPKSGTPIFSSFTCSLCHVLTQLATLYDSC